MSTRFKDPAERLDYSVDFTALLEADDIDTIEVTVTGGLTLVSSSFTGKVVTAFVSGGTLGSTADIVFTVNTTGARKFVRRISLRIVER